MEYDFTNADVERVFDDFEHHKADFDDLMPDALQDLDTAVKGVKDRRDGFAVSDDISALLEQNANKFGLALNSASAAKRAEWAPKLAEILVAAVDLNPRNSENIIRSALRIEKAYEGADTGILLKVADRVSFRYPEHLTAVLNATDEHMQKYEAQDNKTADGYKAFYKVYTNANRKTRSQEVRDRAVAAANSIFGKIEMAKGNVSFEKLLQRVKDNPENEAVAEAFEKDLNTLMAQNPQKTVEDIQANLKDISKMESQDAREELYSVIIEAAGSKIKADTPEELKAKSAAVFSVVEGILRSERNEYSRRVATATATDIAQRFLVDENKALIVADGKEEQTLSVLGRMADANGGQFGLKEILVATAEKFKASPEAVEKIETAMLKALDADQKFGNPPSEAPLSPLEEKMAEQKRNRDNKNRIDARILTLLNIPSKKLHIERNPDKPFYPTKSEMRKVVNLLSQYKEIDYSTLLHVLGKIDKENFSNVDDAILDSFAKKTVKMQEQDKKYLTDELTGIRTKMHTKGIQDKKAKLVAMDTKENKTSHKPAQFHVPPAKDDTIEK